MGNADKTENPANTRGRAVSTVTVQRDRTIVHGILADGTAHGFVLQTNWKQDDDLAAFLGRQFLDGSWGKTIIDGQLQTCRGEGFTLHYTLLSYDQAQKQLDPRYSLG